MFAPTSAVMRKHSIYWMGVAFVRHGVCARACGERGMFRATPTPADIACTFCFGSLLSWAAPTAVSRMTLCHPLHAERAFSSPSSFFFFLFFSSFAHDATALFPMGCGKGIAPRLETAVCGPGTAPPHAPSVRL